LEIDLAQNKEVNTLHLGILQDSIYGKKYDQEFFIFRFENRWNDTQHQFYHGNGQERYLCRLRTSIPTAMIVKLNPHAQLL